MSPNLEKLLYFLVAVGVIIGIFVLLFKLVEAV